MVSGDVLLFISQLSHAGIKFDALFGAPVDWPKSTVTQFDPAKVPDLPASGVWLKPLAFNQGGYDAVFIHKHVGLVRFVQITRSDAHSLKLEFFHKLLAALRDSAHFVVTTLEIVFVVDATKQADFKISPVTGQGLLAAFTGWEKRKEKDKVTILGLNGLDQ